MTDSKLFGCRSSVGCGNYWQCPSRRRIFSYLEALRFNTALRKVFTQIDPRLPARTLLILKCFITSGLSAARQSFFFVGDLFGGGGASPLRKSMAGNPKASENGLALAKICLRIPDIADIAQSFC